MLRVHLNNELGGHSIKSVLIPHDIGITNGQLSLYLSVSDFGGNDQCRPITPLQRHIIHPGIIGISDLNQRIRPVATYQQLAADVDGHSIRHLDGCNADELCHIVDRHGSFIPQIIGIFSAGFTGLNLGIQRGDLGSQAIDLRQISANGCINITPDLA